MPRTKKAPANIAPDLKTLARPVASLKPDTHNARRHDKRNLDAIKNSLQAHGQRKAIVAHEDGTILAGNGTLQAALSLGWEVLAVSTFNRKPSESDAAYDARARAYAISDNRTAELATWDLDVLQAEYATILEANAELASTLDLDDVLAGLEEPAALVDDDVPAPPKKPTTKPGDVWKFPSGHVLVCGDSTNASMYALEREGVQPGLCFTDPPYNTGMTSKTQAFPGKRLAKKNEGATGGNWLTHMFDDSFTPEQWEALLSSFTRHVHDHLAKDAVAYVFLDWRRSHELVPHIKKAGFTFSNLIVWDKMVHGLGSDYKFTHEFLHVARKGKPKLDTHQGDVELSDVWHIQRAMGHDEEHATKKPIELPARCMRHASRPGDHVLDPFMGSGSTLIAAEQLGRVAHGIELDPKYVDVTIKRYVTLTGKRPTNQRGEEWIAPAA